MALHTYLSDTNCLPGVGCVHVAPGGVGGRWRYDVSSGNCVMVEISVHVSVLFFAQNKPVNNSFVDFCGSKCISERKFVDRSHGLFNPVTSGGSKNTGSAKCDRWRSTVTIVLCPCCTNMCLSRRGFCNPPSFCHCRVMGQESEVLELK